MLFHVSLWLLTAMCPPRTAENNRLTPVVPSNNNTQQCIAADCAPPKSVFPCLSGIINDYTPVLGFGCDSSTLQVGPLTGFAAGDKVLLIQMQVPQVDLSNTANFGTLLNTTCIGNYEFNRVQSLGGNTIQLKYALTRPYDVSGKVQLVRVPEYDSAMVCNLTCLPWNGATGGVLALDVKTQLTLMGNLDVSGRGFRGGIVEFNNIPWVFGEQQYYYPPQSTLAAQKGEGIVPIPADQSFGRGRAGNGGGGGNAHNAGGGGGAGGGAGGNGGLEITDLPASPTPNTDGIGGAKYFDTNAQKVLLGGGAGAGHANDSRGTSGGAGGGMIFLIANTMQTNNFRIMANGVDVFGGIDQNDGQGGGGGGGTVVLDIGQINGMLPCELKGGRGGSNPYTPDFQLHGPGGGGGGGKLLLTQNSPNVVPFLQGGANGLTSQNLTNGAQPGEAGRILTGFVLPAGTILSHPVSNNMLLSFQSPSCAGLSTGQIGIFQSTALAFRLNGGPWQPDSIFTNLAPGTYQIGLQFSGGCTLDTIATLLSIPPVRDSLLSVTDADCIQGGAIAVAAVSGVAPFEFQINGGSWQPGGFFDNLAPGTYHIVLRDAAGCLLSTDYTIQAPPPTTQALLSNTGATCINGGEIEVEASSGTLPFEFQLNNGPWQSSGTFTNIPAGQYNITLRDGAGCTDTKVYDIGASPPAMDSLLSLNHSTCVSGGSLVLEAVSGTAPFEFQLNAGAWQQNGVFSNLSAGNYTVVLRDAAGCTQLNNYNIEAPPPVSQILQSLHDATCIAGGAISVIAGSGTAPFEFQLDQGAWQPQSNFTGLMPGNYTITIRDGAGCTQSTDYAVEAPPPPSAILLALENATCLEQGSLLLVAQTGSPPFEFQLNGGVWQGNSSFTGLTPGDYMVTMRDAEGCTQSGNYTIQAPPPALISLTSLADATCLTGGEITVGAISGTAPFEFQINGGLWQSGGQFDNLPAGNYTVVLRDAAGCTQASSYSIQMPPPAVQALVSIAPATCVSGGSLIVVATSGTAPFEFQLNGGPWQTGGTFSGLPAAIYTVALRDAKGCTQSASYSIDAPPIPMATLLSLFNATCVDGGSFELETVSGTAPFEFQLNGGPWQTSNAFNHLPPGNYTVTLRDAAGCTHSSDQVILPPPPVRDTLLSRTEIACDVLGSLEVGAISGTPPVQFQLNNNALQSTGVFTGLSGGDYTVTLHDAAGCTHVSMYDIAPYEPLLLQFDSLGAIDCRHATGYIAVSASGGLGDYTFHLNDGVTQPDDGYFQAISAGVYDVRVVDSTGCEAILENLTVPDQVDTALTWQTVTIYEGSDFELPDGSRTARPGQYPFRYQTTEGCDSVHIITLIVLKRHVYIPNVFSPGADGQNDYFTVYADASLETVENLQVFDRWGELVFQKKNFLPNVDENGWDGNFRGRPVNPGMFVWLVQLKFVDGLERTLSGDVTVVR